MSRSFKPMGKLARVTGVNLESKSKNIPPEKSFRNFTAGKSTRRSSEYGKQLIAKQVIRYTYGVSEKQFYKYMQNAQLSKSVTGTVLLQLLEQRLDNVIYRLGFAATRKEARQIVSHKGVTVNGQLNNIPSFIVSPGDVVALTTAASEQMRVQDSMKKNEEFPISEWLSLNAKDFEGTFVRLPERHEMSMDFNENLVVEYYSR